MDAEMSKSINLCFRTLKLFGWWQDGKQSWAYFILGYLANFILIWLLLITQIDYITKLTNIDDFIEILGLFLTLITVITKSVYFLIKIKRIEKTVDDFEELLKFSEHPSVTGRDVIRKKTKQIYKIFLIFWTTAILSCTNQLIALIRNHETTFKFGYHYVEGESNTGFWVTSVYMSFNSFITTSADIVFDLMPVIFMGYAIGLIVELVEVIAEIKTNADLVKCVQVHVKIKKFVKDIEKSFATPIAVQGCISSIIFCVCAFLLTTGDEFSKSSAAFIFLIPMVIEISLPCYFGQELVTASSKLSNAMFHASWMNGDFDRHTVKLFMENTKNDLEISAFRLFRLNIETFGSICIMAYRLFAVLNNVNN